MSAAENSVSGRQMERWKSPTAEPACGAIEFFCCDLSEALRGCLNTRAAQVRGPDDLQKQKSQGNVKGNPSSIFLANECWLRRDTVK